MLDYLNLKVSLDVLFSDVFALAFSTTAFLLSVAVSAGIGASLAGLPGAVAGGTIAAASFILTKVRARRNDAA